ncbi:hypothetical protein ISR94_00930 [Candidatus Microgenomates bacterium]|nr:hypothetical protein [Candidatus Microgenomates bacterium]
MKIKELKKTREKELKALEGLLDKKVLEMSKIQVKILSGKEKNLKAAKLVKRDVAQLLTLINEKKIDDKLESEEVKNSVDNEKKVKSENITKKVTKNKKKETNK